MQYTKTQLIDMAIDELGENPDWMVDFICVAVSTESNAVWGSGKFILISKKGQIIWESLTPDSWQLVCTREEFEQRVAERKASNPTNTDTVIPTTEWWDYENDKALSFPPAGTECAINFMGTWTKTLIVGFGSDGSCIYEYDLLGIKYYYPIEVGDINVFRPLPAKPKLTERQQAGLKLFRALNTGTHISDEEVLAYDRFEDYCRVYDQGLLK